MDILKNFHSLQRFMPNFGIRPPRGSGASTLFHDQQKMRKFCFRTIGNYILYFPLIDEANVINSPIVYLRVKEPFQVDFLLTRKLNFLDTYDIFLFSEQVVL
jgi:hypothetical protein